VTMMSEGSLKRYLERSESEPVLADEKDDSAKSEGSPMRCISYVMMVVIWYRQHNLTREYLYSWLYKAIQVERQDSGRVQIADEAVVVTKS